MNSSIYTATSMNQRARSLCSQELLLLTKKGPATEALEREANKKRRRLNDNAEAEAEAESSAKLHSFATDSLFDSLLEEAFPVIEWNFDDDESDEESSSCERSDAAAIEEGVSATCVCAVW
jgi:hypothetical protein